MSGLAIISILFFGAEPKSSIVWAIFCAVILTCILMSEDEDERWDDERYW